ncbi:hypothetical protein [Brevibacillus sp. NRS-1366]|uniref:hypothetical protein n=1 Tax=Brevibacillus sp. NRS-1366 TaxID=3233899 RepID=UPI003D25B2E8
MKKTSFKKIGAIVYCMIASYFLIAGPGRLGGAIMLVAGIFGTIQIFGESKE